MLERFFRVLSHGKLTALLFHKVPRVRSPYASQEMDLVEFERVLSVAVRLFRIIPLHEAVLALRAGNLPPRAACITFDDGYPDWLHGVVPVLEQYKAHATFFITSGQFYGLPMWNERILQSVSHAPQSMETIALSSAELPTILVGTPALRRQAVQQLDSYLKYQQLEVRERVLQELESLTGTALDQVPVMTTEDLRAIHSKGFAIGSHTVSHPILARCSPSLAMQEIAQAREQLESIVCGQVTAFAYPNGAPIKDFGPEHIEMVRQAGYTSAVTTHWGAAKGDTSVFQIPRFTPWGPTTAKMDWQFARNLVLRPLSMAEPVSARKRVLMVAFHFPPQAGSSGILRTLNFVKNLPHNGWEPAVLTASPHAYTEQRNDLVASIPPSTRVMRAFALDTARHLSIAHKYPRVLALPDRWASWWPHAVIKGLREIRRHRPDRIWSTYPISTAHLIGGTLARLTGLPWVADFRDPMVSDSYPSDALHRGLWKWLEAFVLRNASACVFTTHRAAGVYRTRYPESASKCFVIENGYDEDAFLGVQPDRHGTPAEVLLLLHSGLIYPKDRNPSTFFEAIKSLIDAGKLNRSRLCIRFRAPHHDEELMGFAASYGLQDVVEIASPIPYREAIAEMMGADLLLVFQGSYFNAQIPAKIYEYLRAQRPVLAVVDPAGDTAQQLRQFEGVYFADIASAGNIATAMGDWLVSAGTDAAKAAYQSNLELVLKYSRRSQAVSLAGQLQKLLP